MKLGKEASRLQDSFERDGKVLGSHISIASEAIKSKWATAYDMAQPLPTRQERLHVFGADPANTGRPEFYGLTWGLIEGGFSGAGIAIGSNLQDGTFKASHYSTGSYQRSVYAGIRVWFRPNMDWCKLSIRPLVNWSGFDILDHKEYDPQLNAKGWGVASAQIGIHVQSWDHLGGAFFNDAGNWLTIWERKEINPSGMRYYSDTADLRSLQLSDVRASCDRSYAIWVSCKAFVLSEARFGLDTRTSTSVSCQLPYLVVEEMDL